jgi:pyrimidine-nucleoside phosphorylase
MNIVDIIVKKRDGFKLSKEEINYFVNGYTNSEIKDYQISSLLMAIYLKGMDKDEACDLALAMANSGDLVDLSSIPNIKVDKHSTGGVGDKVTLILGPLVSACGANFAKMSGRGLGHTGGTIDKFESIPGYRVELSETEFLNQVKKIKIAVIGQSGEIAPADKKLYALRDVTGTIESIPLIASSIMSKKIASGADAIVLDVKVGTGAFMKNLEEARELSKLMVEIGRIANKNVTAIITDMNEPLGNKIGNSLEVYEAISCLEGNGPKDLIEVVLEIGSFLLIDAKISSSIKEARKLLLDTLNSKKALLKFRELIEAQGGDISYVDNKEKLINAKIIPLISKESGFVHDINCLSIGKASLLLGAGRLTKEEPVDHFVGIEVLKKVGDRIEKGDIFAKLYVHEKGILEATNLVYEAYHVSSKEVKTTTILDIIR